jgi:hypothetical protein
MDGVTEIFNNLSSVLTGDMVSLSLKIALLVGVPLITLLVSWIMKRNAEREKQAESERNNQDHDKKDTSDMIGDNQRDSGQADKDKSESDDLKRELERRLKGEKPL